MLPEPLGGAHRDPQQMAADLKAALTAALTELSAKPVEQLLEQRAKRLDSFGAFRAA